MGEHLRYDCEVTNDKFYKKNLLCVVMVNWYMYGAVLSKVKETTKLTRLVEAVRNLYILAKKLDDRQAKFAVVLIHHVERTCFFPPKT